MFFIITKAVIIDPSMCNKKKTSIIFKKKSSTSYIKKFSEIQTTFVNIDPFTQARLLTPNHPSYNILIKRKRDFHINTTWLRNATFISNDGNNKHTMIVLTPYNPGILKMKDKLSTIEEHNLSNNDKLFTCMEGLPKWLYKDDDFDINCNQLPLWLEAFGKIPFCLLKEVPFLCLDYTYSKNKNIPAAAIWKTDEVEIYMDGIKNLNPEYYSGIAIHEAFHLILKGHDVNVDYKKNYIKDDCASPSLYSEKNPKARHSEIESYVLSMALLDNPKLLNSENLKLFKNRHAHFQKIYNNTLKRCGFKNDNYISNTGIKKHSTFKYIILIFVLFYYEFY